jgi:hypothetical protein
VVDRRLDKKLCSAQGAQPALALRHSGDEPDFEQQICATWDPAHATHAAQSTAQLSPRHATSPEQQAPGLGGHVGHEMAPQSFAASSAVVSGAASPTSTDDASTA